MSTGIAALKSRLLAGAAPLAVIFGALAAAPALAADDAAAAEESELSEVVVTARHREERLQDVPLSVSAVSGEVQAEQRLDKLQDFAQKIPNFNPRTSNPRTSALSIRGVGGIAGGGDGSESGVGLIVDNVFYTHVGFAWAPLYDIQNIQVARGPQGTLLGKNTTVGAVLISTAPPRFPPDHAIEISVANYNRITVNAHTGGALVDDKVAYRLSFFRDRADGQVPNRSFPQVDDKYRHPVKFNDLDRWGVRGQLLVKLGDDIQTRLIAEYSQTNEFNNYGGIVAPVLTQYANGAPYRTYVQKVAQLYGITNVDFDPYTAESTNPSTLRQNTKGVSNELTWNIDGFTLTSVSAYRQFLLWPRNSQGSNGLFLYSLGYDNNAKLFSQEFRLASPRSEVLDYQLGLYYLHDARRSNDRIIFGKDAASFYGNVAPSTINPAVLDKLEYDQFGRAKTDSIAGFGQATWHVAEKIDLTGGLRLTYEKRTGSNVASSVGGAANLSAADLGRRNTLLLNQFGGYFAIKGSADNTSLSWLINPSYKVNDNLLFYGSVARGVKSGAVNTVAVPIYVGGVLVDYQDVITKPETSLDFELGFKSAWFDRSLTFNVNLYWNDIKNYQGLVTDTTSYRDATGAVAPKTFLGNIAKVRLKGVEVESAWAPTSNLDLSFAGAVTDSRYVDYADAGAPVDYQYPGGPAALSLSGTRIPSVPPWSFNLGATYHQPAGQFQGVEIDAFAYANEAVQGKTRYSSPWANYLGQKTYSVTNAGVGFRRPDGSLSLSIWAKNLFDEKYFVAKTAGTTNANATVSLGEPRTYGVTFAVAR
jgi:iron complex outermembrane receptor protein